MSANPANTASAAPNNKRRLRSGRLIDTPAPPPKRQATRAANVNTNQTYYMEGFPAPLRLKKISKCFIEFLHLGLPDTANHTIMRIVFQHSQKDASPRAPAETKGLTLDFSPDGNLAAKIVEGALEIGTFRYDGSHRQAVHVVELPVSNNKTVKDFLNVIETTNILPAGFQSVGTDLVGCRDFVSQLVYRLNEAKVLTLPTDARTSVYDHFNHRYHPGGTSAHSDVALAAYKDYVHDDIVGIDYED